MKKLLVVLGIALGTQGFAQESPSIKEVAERYDIFEFVMAQPGDTLAIISRENVPADFGLIVPDEVMTDEDGTYSFFVFGNLRLMYTELNDGRFGTTVSDSRKL